MNTRASLGFGCRGVFEGMQEAESSAEDVEKALGGGGPGSNDEPFSTTTIQYFYGIGLGNGWQILSGPVITYDWKADSDEAWTVPLGFGVARTTKLSGETWKFQGQVEYYVEQPDSFGPDWLLKFTISPVIQNPFVR